MKYAIETNPNPAAWFILLIAVALGIYLFVKWGIRKYEEEQAEINRYWEDKDLVF